MKEFRPAKKRIEVSVGESVRILRELQELSQNDLAQLSLGSRQRINKILSEWRERGIVELEGSRYLIRDMSALVQETELHDRDT